MKRAASIAALVYCMLFAFQVSSVFSDEETQYSELHQANIFWDECLTPTRAIVAEKLASEDGKQELIYLRDGIDLSKRDLTNVKINHVKLENVDFSNSDLTGADLRLSIFVNCNFSNAILKNIRTDGSSGLTKFINCKFDGAVTLRFPCQCLDDKSIVASFRPAESVDYFFPEDYDHRDGAGAPSLVPRRYCEFLDKSELTNVRLFGFCINLSREQFVKSINYKEKLFCGMQIESENESGETKLNCSNLDFSNGVFSGICFKDVDFKNCNFENAYVNGYFSNCDFEGCNFENACFSGSEFFRCNFAGVNLETASFNRTDVGSQNNFEDANLKNVQIHRPSRCNFKNADLENATITESVTECDFEGANLKNVKFLHSITGYLPTISITASTKITTEQIRSTWNWQNDQLQEFSPATREWFKIERD